MADGSYQDGADLIATDEITGGVADEMKVARSKTGFGVDGAYGDVTPEVGLPVAGAVKEFSGTDDADGDTVLFTADVAEFRWVAIFMSAFPDASAETGWVQFETSPDGTNWAPAALIESVDAGWTLQAGYASPLTAVGVVDFRYYRATLHNGTGDVLPTPVTVIAQFYSEPAALLGARSTTLRFTTADALQTKLIDADDNLINEGYPLPVSAFGHDGDGHRRILTDVDGRVFVTSEHDNGPVMQGRDVTNDVNVPIRVDDSGRPEVVGSFTAEPWLKVGRPALSGIDTGIDGACTFGGYMLTNPNASVAYVQIFDYDFASVTLGTTAPEFVVAVPPEGSISFEVGGGIDMATGITVAATTEPDNATAPTEPVSATFLFRYPA